MDIENEQQSENPESGALSVIVSSEILAQVSTAKRYPRIFSKFAARALELATFDIETARSCIYSVPRAGKKLVGPSIRFAEIVASAWGNLRIGARVIGNDGKVVMVEAVCHDLETNVAYKVEKQRKITNSDGNTFSEDMIVVTGAAACSIAIRDSIMRVIPKAVSKQIYDKVLKVSVGEKGSKTFMQRRDDALNYFNGLGISTERILAAVNQPRFSDINQENLEYLIGLATALKNEDITPEEAFPEPQKVEMKILAKEKHGIATASTSLEQQGHSDAVDSAGKATGGNAESSSGNAQSRIEPQGTGTVAQDQGNALKRDAGIEKARQAKFSDIEIIRKLLMREGVDEDRFMTWGRVKGRWQVHHLEELAIQNPARLTAIINEWTELETEIANLAI